MAEGFDARGMILIRKTQPYRDFSSGIGGVLVFSSAVADRGKLRASSGPHLGEQGFLDDHQVGESEQGMQLRGVLGQPAVAQLPVPEQVRAQLKGRNGPVTLYLLHAADRLWRLPGATGAARGAGSTVGQAQARSARSGSGRC
jgi:hypothetical protein